VTYRMGQRSFPLDSTFFFFLRDKQSCKGQRVTHLGSHLNGLPFFLHCVVNAITPCVTHFQSIHFRIPSLLYKFMSASRTLLPNFCVHALVLPKNNEPWLVVVCVSGIKWWNARVAYRWPTLLSWLAILFGSSVADQVIQKTLLFLVLYFYAVFPFLDRFLYGTVQNRIIRAVQWHHQSDFAP